MKILLRSAKVIDPGSDHHQETVDILIEDGKIAEIGSSLKIDNIDREIRLKDLHVSKGWFDSSVSFGEPGYEERETLKNGLDTAAKSGYTAVCLNPATDPVIDNNGAVTSLLSKSKGHPVKLYPIGALTRKSEGNDLAELFDMRQAGAVAFGDFKRAVMHPNLLKLALLYVQNFNGLVQSYPQDDDVAGKGLVNEQVSSTNLGLRGIPALAEEIQVARDLSILEYTGGKLHIPTISTTIAVRLIKDAKEKGLDVSCSVAIHNLAFSDDVLVEFDTNTKVLPPLRTKDDIKSLISGIKDGTIDFITSDHIPIDVEHKKVEFEHALFGTIGLESAFGTISSFSTNIEETIDLLTRGRSRFGIKEPEIKEGKEANLSLFTPNGSYIFTEEHIHSTSKNSLFLNSTLRGKVYGIISGNDCVISD